MVREYKYKCNLESVGKTETHNIKCSKCDNIVGVFSASYELSKSGKSALRRKDFLMNHPINVEFSVDQLFSRDDIYIPLRKTDIVLCKECAIKHNAVIDTIQQQNMVIVANRDLEKAKKERDRIRNESELIKAETKTLKDESYNKYWVTVGQAPKVFGVKGVFLNYKKTGVHRIIINDGSEIITSETIRTNYKPKNRSGKSKMTLNFEDIV